MTGDAFVILQGEIDALTLLSNNLRQAPIRGPWFREGLRAVARDTAEQLDEIRDRLREVLAVAGGRAAAVLVALLVATASWAQCVKPCDPPPTCLKNCDPPTCVKNCDTVPPPNDPCVKNCPPPPSDPQAPYQMTVGDLYSSWRGNDLAATIGTKAAVSGLQTLLNNVDDPGVNPFGAGALNYEHLMRGSADPRNWFAPRLGRFDLSVVDWQTVRLTRAVQDDPWQVGATLTYRSVVPHFIDLEAAFLITDATQFAPHHDALFFFASYMYNTSVAPHFRGRAGPDEPETWLTIPLEAATNAGTVRHVSAVPLLYDPPNTFDAAYSFFSTDWPRFTQPFYCGLAEPGMVYEIMFDRGSTPVDEMRWVIYQTKVIDGTTPHPAWDWEYIVHQPVSGQTYGFRARMGWRAGTLADCHADYVAWAASLPR